MSRKAEGRAGSRPAGDIERSRSELLLKPQDCGALSHALGLHQPLPLSSAWNSCGLEGLGDGAPSIRYPGTDHICAVPSTEQGLREE